jgi:tRNA threonylcarbamoyladenosine biosynthesis protein TsaE
VTARPRVEETAAPAQTEALAGRVAAGLAPGDVVLVSGELGTGKTTFVRGACRALGVEGPVTSPTFTIGSRHEGRIPISHLDLYRLAGLEQEDPALLTDYLAPDRVAFVEWPEHGGAWLPPVRARVTLEHLDERHRRLRIEGDDDLGV